MCIGRSGRPAKGDRPVIAASVAHEEVGAIQALAASTGASQGDVTGALLLLGFRSFDSDQFDRDLASLREERAQNSGLAQIAGRFPRALGDRARAIQSAIPGSVPLLLIVGALLRQGIRHVNPTFRCALADASTIALDPSRIQDLLPTSGEFTADVLELALEPPIAV